MCGSYSVMWIGGGIGSLLWPNVRDADDARVSLEVSNESFLVFKASLIAPEDNAERRRMPATRIGSLVGHRWCMVVQVVIGIQDVSCGKSPAILIITNSF